MTTTPPFSWFVRTCALFCFYLVLINRFQTAVLSSLLLCYLHTLLPHIPRILKPNLLISCNITYLTRFCVLVLSVIRLAILFALLIGLKVVLHSLLLTTLILQYILTSPTIPFSPISVTAGSGSIHASIVSTSRCLIATLLLGLILQCIISLIPVLPTITILTIVLCLIVRPP